PLLRRREMSPDLKRRLNTTLHFRTFGADELTQIFSSHAEKAGYKPTEDAMKKVREICALMKGSEDPAAFGNARESRTLCEDSVAQQPARLVAQAGSARQPT